MSALSFLEWPRWHVLLSTWTANPVPSFPHAQKVPLILLILLTLILVVGTLRLPWGLTKLLQGRHRGVFTSALGFLRDVTALKPPPSSGGRHAPEQLKLQWRQMPSSAARPRQGHAMSTRLRCSQGSLRNTNMKGALRWVVWLLILNAQRTFAFKLLFSSTWWALSPCSIDKSPQWVLDPPRSRKQCALPEMQRPLICWP